MITSIIEVCIDLFFYIFIAIIGFYTGELILFLITLGKRKIRWNYYRDIKNSRKFVILTEISIWIGCIFWVLVIMYLCVSMRT